MRSNLVGRVKNTYLPLTHGLLPLYEAVVNSIDAIEERDIDGAIRILIHRDDQQEELDTHGNTIADIISFEVIDNGAGFTEANFASFETLDTLAKADRGGKGVGRLLWLCAFEEAIVESIYEENGSLFRRSFAFRPTEAGIEDHVVESVEGRPAVETRVRLSGFKTNYRNHVRKSLPLIARQTLEHLLEYFVLERAPEIVVQDQGSAESESLWNLFRSLYDPVSESRVFSVEGEQFVLLDVLFDAEASPRSHSLNFCAHDRVVKSLNIRETQIPHLERSLQYEDGRKIYSAYVGGTLLNERVDNERTDFMLDSEGQLEFGGGPTWEKIRDAAMEQVASFLEGPTARARERALARVREFVETKAPKYRVLLQHRQADLEQLSATLTDSKLDLELHRLLSEWRADLRAEAAEQLGEDTPAPGEDTEHDRRRGEVLAKLQEALKSDLAEYVVERRTVLEFFRKLLGKTVDGSFPAEEALHELFFPLRTSSDSVDYDDHNLWIIDERLAYHQYLASDLQFRSQDAPVSLDSSHRPDLLIYNRSMVYSEQPLPVSSIVVVEFKRPERTDYDDKTSPIRQVFRYITEIRDGKATRDDGSTITVGEDLPFYCHIIATLTEKLRRDAVEFNFTRMPDGNGYFAYNSNLRAYVEIVSFRKVLDDAMKRNRMFFDKLGVPLY